MNDTPTRIRVEYCKLGSLRFTGHIDLQRLFERALRRSGLPIRYSQGFNPKVRLNLASALPLGYSSRAELLDFWMDENRPAVEIGERLRKAFPAELPINKVWQVCNREPSLQSSLISSEFVISFPQILAGKLLAERLDDLMQQEVIEIQNRGKIKNLRQMVLKYHWNDQFQALEIVMTATPGNTGRPDDLVRVLGLDPWDCSYERTKLNLEGNP